MLTRAAFVFEAFSSYSKSRSKGSICFMIIPKINYHNDDILLDILYIVQAQMNKFSRVLYENDNENFGILAV